MHEEPNLFNQPEPEPAPKLDPATDAVLKGEQRARERDLRNKHKRLGKPWPTPTNEELFHRFHEENPHVYDALVRLALKAKAAGVTKWGINAVIEVFRWEYAIQTKGDTFKINNNHAPYYARLIMKNEAALADFFNTRTTRA